MWLRRMIIEGRSSTAIARRTAASRRVDVVGDLADALDMPSVRLEALAGIVAVGELGRAVDRDVVVVVDVDQAAEPQMAGERCGLVADALLEVAVAAITNVWWSDDVGAEPRPQVALGDAHADAVGEALAERPGGHLDPRGLVLSGWPAVLLPHCRNCFRSSSSRP